jgi:hypothetical protein
MYKLNVNIGIQRWEGNFHSCCKIVYDSKNAMPSEKTATMPTDAWIEPAPEQVVDRL